MVKGKADNSLPTLNLFKGSARHLRRGHGTEHLMLLDLGRENCTYPGKCWGWKIVHTQEMLVNNTIGKENKLGNYL